MFALHAAIEIPNSCAESEPTTDEVRTALIARCSWLSERCECCYRHTVVSILSVKRLKRVMFSVFWQEDYCCSDFADAMAVERDAEMESAEFEYLYPESEWRPWLEQQ